MVRARGCFQIISHYEFDIVLPIERTQGKLLQRLLPQPLEHRLHLLATQLHVARTLTFRQVDRLFSKRFAPRDRALIIFDLTLTYLDVIFEHLDDLCHRLVLQNLQLQLIVNAPLFENISFVAFLT